MQPPLRTTTQQMSPKRSRILCSLYPSVACWVFFFPTYIEIHAGIPYVYPVESEHVIWHEEFHGELHHQTGRAVLADREDGFVWVVGQTGQVLPLLLRQHHGQRQHT